MRHHPSRWTCFLTLAATATLPFFMGCGGAFDHAPVFTAEPQDVAVKSGDSVRLNVATCARPADTTYQWFKKAGGGKHHGGKSKPAKRDFFEVSPAENRDEEVPNPGNIPGSGTGHGPHQDKPLPEKSATLNVTVSVDKDNQTPPTGTGIYYVIATNAVGSARSRDIKVILDGKHNGGNPGTHPHSGPQDAPGSDEENSPLPPDTSTPKHPKKPGKQKVPKLPPSGPSTPSDEPAPEGSVDGDE